MDRARRTLDEPGPDEAEDVAVPPATLSHRLANVISVCGGSAGTKVESSAAEAGRGTGPNAWDGFVPWWNWAFAVTLAATTAFAVIEVHGAGRLAAVLALYAALAVLYVLTLARSVGSSSGAGSGRAGFIYLSGAGAIFAAACALFPGSALLLFVLVPHCFMLLRLRPAFVAVLGLALVYAAAELANNGVNTATVASVAIGGAFTILLSVLLGSYITKIIDQSLQRASLIAELERARDELAVLSREAGALAERERLAREIHDALAQGFTSVIMLAEAAQAAVDRGDLGLARRQLGLLEDAARDGLVEARSLIETLAPLALQGASLVGAIERVSQDLGARFGFVTHFEVQGDPTALSNNAEIVLLRAAQEALANVGRHASARSASVKLRFGGNLTSLEVADDGIGFDVARPSGFGLSQLRSRAAELGGAAEVSSIPGHGTTIRVSVPTGGEDTKRAPTPEPERPAAPEPVTATGPPTSG